MEGYNIAIGFYDNVQIDTEHILVGSDFMTQATGPWSYFWGYYYCVVSTSFDKNNIVAFKPSNVDYSLVARNFIFYNDDHQIIGDKSIIATRSSRAYDPITCNIFTIGKLNNMPKPDYGMMVYDAAGNVIYNSNCKILKINEILEVDINSLPVTLSHSSVNPYYIVPFMSKVWHSKGHFNPKKNIIEYSIKYYTIGIKKISPTQISANWFFCNSRPLNTPYMTYNEGWIESYHTPFRIAVCNID